MSRRRRPPAAAMPRRRPCRSRCRTPLHAAGCWISSWPTAAFDKRQIPGRRARRLWRSSTPSPRATALALRPLLSDDVFAAFDAAIAARTGARRRHLVEAARRAHRRRGAAWPAGGNHRRLHAPSSPSRHDVTDVWTFARNLDSSDPNWTLVATSGDAAGSRSLVLAALSLALLALAALHQPAAATSRRQRRLRLTRVSFRRSAGLERRRCRCGAGVLPAQLRPAGGQARQHADGRRGYAGTVARLARVCARSRDGDARTSLKAISRPMPSSGERRPVHRLLRAGDPRQPHRHGAYPDAGLWPAARSGPRRSGPVQSQAEGRAYLRPGRRAIRWCPMPTAPRSTPRASPTRRSCSGPTIRWRCSSCRSRARAGCCFDDGSMRAHRLCRRQWPALYRHRPHPDRRRRADARECLAANHPRLAEGPSRPGAAR